MTSPRRARGPDGVAARRAVVIGVPGDEVPHAVDDGRAVAAVLRARGYVVTVVDDRRGSAAAPTRAGVLTTVRRVAAACGDDDVLVVYACCHGVRDRGRPWLLLADSAVTDAGRVVRGLALSALLDALRRRARHVAVFLEACHIGLGLDPAIGRALRHCGARGGGFALLAGSTADAQSLDDSDGGVFSRCLRDGLAGAAADPDGGVRFSRLARHVQAGVAAWNLSPEGALVDSRQRPILRLELADVPLVASPGVVALAPPPAAAITAAAWSRSGHRLVVGAADGSVAIHDPRTGARVAIDRHRAAVTSVAVSIADLALSAADDGELRYRRVDDGEPMPTTRRPRAIVRAALWTDTGLGQVLGGDGGLRVQGMRDALLGGDGDRLAAAPIAALASIDGGFVSADAAGEVRAWVGATRQSVRLGRVPTPVIALAASARTGAVVVACGRGAPRRWDPAGDRMRAIPGHRAPVQAVALAEDGTLAATGDAAGVVRILDGATGALRRRVRSASAITALAFAPDGATLFVGDAAGHGRVVAL